MFSQGFIKDKKLLEENSRIDNLLDLSVEIDRFSTFIDNIEISSLVGFIGRFGSGKSNFLNQIKTKYGEDANWFEFDAWKYPERQDLWENFILDIAEEISNEDLESSKRKIEGKNPTVWVEKLTQFCSGLGIGNFADLLKTSPTKRIIELQNILLNLLSQVKENNIYIILEDIDRSGDNGIYFLETLNHFLKNIEIEKRIIVIVPIGQESYEKESLKISYLKSLDYFYNFSLKDVKLNLLVEKLFIDEIIRDSNKKGQITTFLEGIFIEFSEQITMRLLKHILRNANLNYIALLKKHTKGIDWRLSILFETAKYIKNQQGEIYISNWIKRKTIGGNESIFSALLDCAIQENHRIRGSIYNSIYEEHYNGDVKEIKPKTFNYKIPFRISNINYKEVNVDDKVLYYTNSFDDTKSYFGVTDDYLI
ncbi:hypothetical protein H3C61_04060 [Candidatus Gracilibacteria bacterium]|nr:hypothetical protein [Candidatus Gracilibacteria bacterium]